MTEKSCGGALGAVAKINNETINQATYEGESNKLQVDTHLGVQVLDNVLLEWIIAYNTIAVQYTISTYH